MKKTGTFRFVTVGFGLLFVVAALVGCGKPLENPSTNLKNELTIDLGNGLSMEFVLIQPGTFLMGTTKSDGASAGAKPQHKVTISKPFYLGKYMVTQEQWQSLMGNNPSPHKEAKCPVEVIWNDCQRFLAKLQEKAPGMNFCLPTEAQWEYACRAGSTGDYCYGDGIANLGEYAWYIDNSGLKPHPVGLKKPNAWGLYDMHGNVLEWCADWFGEDYYAHSPSKDPQGPSSGKSKITRGGSCRLIPAFVRSSFRLYGLPSDGCGLRVCIVDLQ